jgi:hypothetical protein
LLVTLEGEMLMSSKSTRLGCAFTLSFAATLMGSATLHAQTVYQTGNSTGFFTPFNSSTTPGTKFGDSGWFGNGSSAPETLREITLGLVTSSTTPVADGSTDIVFTFNDGDPSGLVFGSGTALYSTTIPNVTLPANDGVTPTRFTLTIPMPAVTTSGGFNNIGWSVGVQNFNYAGQFGFQNRGNVNSIGFYTNNASQFTPGPGWSLFAFGPNNPADIANFVVTVVVPEPHTFAVASLVGVVALCRRSRR